MNASSIIGRQDAFGRTPLHYAAHMKLTGAVALLVKKGAHLGLADNEGRTALHHLADPLHHYHTIEPVDGHVEEDEHLSTVLSGEIKGGGGGGVIDNIINHRDNAGSAALHMAARSASDAVVALLLRLGADPNLPENREGPEGAASMPPLHLAARRADWVRLGTYEPREYAAWSRRAARIKALLLGAGADTGMRDAQGRTAAEVEEATDRDLRRGRAEYLERLASRPLVDYGRGRGFGRGRGRGGFSAPPGDDRVHLSSGAGHGRGG
ncbi:ankyrin repeat-containing domain protein [Chaetomidium leptoderma]|uniref:Ankyrin repeat-containing domain protein n=1 Tax=Chaetomidium leptoderma TaxID=669021 RepID=A0AAN6VKC1_9PEZI|nr:ankyrin repeat-containing domain protein [Chaetomidium leptoderma]